MSLSELVRNGEFRANRDRHLIGSDDDLEWPAFAHLQHLYRSTLDDIEHRQIAIDFQRLVRTAHHEVGVRSGRKQIRSVNVRLPEVLHDELKEASSKSGRSLQREIVFLLEEALVARE